jgi:hypothetical protein
MQKSKYMIVIIVLLIIAGLFFYFRSHASSEVRDHSYGPFVIRLEQFSTRDIDMNYGWVTRKNISYSVLHQGKVVSFPSALQSNTGFSHLWRVYILKDAPVPTILAGSQSLFMIKAKGDAYEVEAMDVQTTDFIKFQWLDGEEGQPSPAFELFMANESTSLESLDTLVGGDYLMINQKMVLHVPTMDEFSFDQDRNHIHDYEKSGDAIAFSPDKSIIVFPGYFQTWNSNKTPTYGNALISYDFRKDIKTVLPYSKNDTRLYRPENLHYQWFVHNFEWDTSGTTSQLKYIKKEKLDLWQGYFRETAFYLYPVADTMLPILREFILNYMKWSPEAVLSDKHQEYTGWTVQMGQTTSIFELIGRDDEVILMQDLYNPTADSTLQLIQDIGKAFNKELLTGKYQSHFTAIPENETF